MKYVVPFFLFAATLLLPLESNSADNIFNSAAEIRSAAGRLADEAVEAGRSPFEVDDYALLTTLAVAGSTAFISQYDEKIRDAAASNRSRGADRFSNAASLIGDPFMHLGISAAVYGGGILMDSPKYRELGEMFGEAVILSDAAALLFKQTTGRGRPDVSSDSGSYRPFQFSNNYDSFPSMHTASSFAMASVMASNSDSRLTGVAAYTAAGLVGFSRIYNDKHWASDVLLGAAIGELCGRVVTRYHATAGSRRVTVVPVVSGSSALLALTGRF